MTKDTFIEEEYFHSRYGKYISLAFESNIFCHLVFKLNSNKLEMHPFCITFTTDSFHHVLQRLLDGFHCLQYVLSSSF